MSGAALRPRRVVLPLVVLGVTLPNLLRNAGAFEGVWPLWRPVLVEAAAVFAGGVAVAAVASGVVAWRRART